MAMLGSRDAGRRWNLGVPAQSALYSCNEVQRAAMYELRFQGSRSEFQAHRVRASMQACTVRFMEELTNGLQRFV